MSASEKVLAKCGSYVALECERYRQFHVRDTRTGITFGADSKAHAIAKAKQMALKSAEPT